MFRKNNKARKLKKIFQLEDYFNWKEMSVQQKINLKRACLFPLLALIVYNFLSNFTYAILIILSFYFIIRLKNKGKISK